MNITKIMSKRQPHRSESVTLYYLRLCASLGLREETRAD
jgi:hypothetical protein